MTPDESWRWATPELMQRAAHLAVLRILRDSSQDELDRLVEEADVLACAGYVLDRTDAAARVEFVRRTQQLARRATAAERELRAAEAALRTAVLDDEWAPADDIGGSRTV